MQEVETPTAAAELLQHNTEQQQHNNSSNCIVYAHRSSKAEKERTVKALRKRTIIE